jgi:hypothetical protein
MIGFALITVYMVFCAVFLAIKGIQTMTQAAEDGSENMTDAIMKAPMFRNIVMSLLATYGLYIISSLISFDPWHLVTSFLQYLLIAPSYINVLNVYAFSNVHDVSWGTKGSDKASEELGVVKTDNKNEVEINILTEAKDIDAVYEAELRVLATKAPPEDSTPNAEQVQEDYYKVSSAPERMGLLLTIQRTSVPTFCSHGQSPTPRLLLLLSQLVTTRLPRPLKTRTATPSWSQATFQSSTWVSCSSKFLVLTPKRSFADHS